MCFSSTDKIWYWGFLVSSNCANNVMFSSWHTGIQIAALIYRDYSIQSTVHSIITLFKVTKGGVIGLSNLPIFYMDGFSFRFIKFQNHKYRSHLQRIIKTYLLLAFSPTTIFVKKRFKDRIKKHCSFIKDPFLKL